MHAQTTVETELFRISDANRALDKEDEKVWRFLHSDRFIQADTVLGMTVGTTFLAKNLMEKGLANPN